MTNRWKNSVVRLGVIGSLTLVLCACETTSPYSQKGELEAKGPQPNFPTRVDGPAPNTSDTQVIATAPPPAVLPAPAPAVAPALPPPPVPSGVVETQALAPLAPPPAPAVAPAPAPTPPRSAAAEPPPPPAAPPPPPAPIFREVATGPVIDAEGPRPATHTVRRGETLSGISRQMGISVKDLQTRNKLGASTNIRPGQRLRGPATRIKVYVVQQGDTLSAVARRFNVTNAQLARASGISATASLRPAQRLTLPSGYRDSGPQRIEVTASGAPVTPAPVATASTNTYARPPSALPGPPVAAATPRPAIVLPPPSTANAGDIVALGRGKFVWPVNGRTIGGFGPRGPSQVSEGIDIAAPLGAEVKASAGGTVIYAGPQGDFGNIVLLDNGGGFYTIYGHLSRVDVRIQDQIRQSQIIGLVGQSGAVTEPEVYFEMRRLRDPREKPMPFDPMLLLPPR